MKNWQQGYRGIGIALLHALVLVALWRGTDTADWLAFAVVYPLAAIGVGVAMHRYFAHRAFRTSRVFQFALALMAALSFGNAVHFAGKHRLHHRHSDAEGDVHAPHQGWWQCWFGSLIDCGYSEPKIRREAAHWFDFPELSFLYRHGSLPALTVCVVLFLIGGFNMMVIGGCLPGVLLLHQSSAVNYFCHCRGQRAFATRDQSTNNLLVALLTYGEGWHNNHHRFPRSARAGLYWWQPDLFYGVICLFETLGLVWEVQRIDDQRLRRADLALHS
ncbi:acyl-CoA desaturase [Parahaliea maris]|uniref:Acyl-CoA desaturase n=1 Tax=Parahaliea maris TaxID=2716870 RepID=A0A5C9A009_9GAMM|nr:acyl-CoA desaturase [Parahaliea maris]TXS94088.1 acyl-CoA desaturase [Parahaliea maris]